MLPSSSYASGPSCCAPRRSCFVLVSPAVLQGSRDRAVTSQKKSCRNMNQDQDFIISGASNHLGETSKHHFPVLPPRRRVVRLLGRPMTLEKLATHPATLLRDSCATPARLLRDILPSISGFILKHFAALSLKMMLRSVPEVITSSKNDKTSDYETYFCAFCCVHRQRQ